MKTQTLLLAAAVVVLASFPASAQPNQGGGYNRDGYSASQNDRRDGYPGANWRDERRDGNYYRQGAYEQHCRRGGNQAAGTIFGALAGGLVGSAASGGEGGAVIGGAVLGGLLGNVISRDIDCDAQPYAFRTYSTGLNGAVGRRYDWRHGNSRGHFTPIREFRRNGTICRDFTETSWRRDGRAITRRGTSCRARDGHWRFD